MVTRSTAKFVSEVIMENIPNSKKNCKNYHILEMGCGRPILAGVLSELGLSVNAIDLPSVNDAITKVIDILDLHEDHALKKIVFQGVNLAYEDAHTKLYFNNKYHTIIDFTGLDAIKFTLLKTLDQSECKCVFVRQPAIISARYNNFKKHMVKLGFTLERVRLKKNVLYFYNLTARENVTSGF